MLSKDIRQFHSPTVRGNGREYFISYLRKIVQMEVYNIDRKFKNKARENLANNLLSMRYERDWSQEKLAELSHSSTRYISDIELGKRKVSIDFINDIAKIFGIPCHELLVDNPKVTRRPRVDSKK